MKRVLKFLIMLFAGCLSFGFIVSKLEKKHGKQGWTSGHKPYGPYEKHIKRPLDFGLALFTLLLFWPIFLIVALLVRINLGKPVIFEQDRPGLGGKIFKLRKFRSMTDERDENGELLPDEKRLTGFGKALRASSGDEVPELINVLKGDMSIVGPRPLRVQYLALYNDHQARRHEVRPGFTGLAQINGRNLISWESKFDWDVQYVDRITFKKDVRIILETIKTVLLREGISSEKSATMEAFKGTKS